MKPEQVIDVLVRQAGAKKDGHALHFPAETEVTLFLALVGETLTVPRVTRLEIEGGLLNAETHRGERIFASAEDIRAVKIERSEASRRANSAGFGK
jgi:hypothetical protein